MRGTILILYELPSSIEDVLYTYVCRLDRIGTRSVSSERIQEVKCSSIDSGAKEFLLGLFAVGLSISIVITNRYRTAILIIVHLTMTIMTACIFQWRR
jgi:hypothetical protein